MSKSLFLCLPILFFFGCRGEDYHVYYDHKNNVVYLDTSDGRDAYFMYVSLYAEGVGEKSTAVDDTLLELTKVSFHEFIDTNNVKLFSVDVEIKKDHEHFGKFRREINSSDTGIVEIPPVYE
jgi:hypothetical protein